MRFENLGPGPDAPDRIHVVVEIPKGSRNKVEYDHEACVFRLDRVLHAPMHYPGDYGFVPGTIAADGDALDVLVLVEEPTAMSCVLSARPVGLLELVDERERDEKVLAVPAEDPRFENVEQLDDLPGHALREVEYFFDVYKELEGKETAALGWKGSQEARAAIREAQEAYEPRQANSGR